MKILFIEDNDQIINSLSYTFIDYEVLNAKTIKEAKYYLEKEDIDLIILDIMLPDGNGLNFFEQAKIKIPTIILSAKDDEIEKGLQLATDYLTKPFSPKELLAKVKKILQYQNLIKIENIIFDINKMQVTKNNIPVSLTALETKILYLLLINKGKVVSRLTLLDKIWEYTGNYVDDHTVTVYIKRIRTKLACNFIKTIKGVGYYVDEKSN